MTAPIAIQDYDPAWPGLFESLRLRIATALNGLATTVEHVGSTAVPGLAAKPIIDIEVLLRSATDSRPAITRLAALGYSHRGDLGVTGREAFQAPLNDFPHHLYVCLSGSQEYRCHIAFRDYLRQHRQDAEAYASLKRKLAAKFGADRDSYTQAKTQFVEEILRRSLQDRWR